MTNTDTNIDSNIDSMSVDQAVKDSMADICPVDLGWAGPHWDKNDPILVRERLIYKVWLKERRLNELGLVHENVTDKLYTLPLSEVMKIAKDIIKEEDFKKITEPLLKQ